MVNWHDLNNLNNMKYNNQAERISENLTKNLILLLFAFLKLLCYNKIKNRKQNIIIMTEQLSEIVKLKLDIIFKRVFGDKKIRIL